MRNSSGKKHFSKELSNSGVRFAKVGTSQMLWSTVFLKWIIVLFSVIRLRAESLQLYYRINERNRYIYNMSWIASFLRVSLGSNKKTSLTLYSGSSIQKKSVSDLFPFAANLIFSSFFFSIRSVWGIRDWL